MKMPFKSCTKLVLLSAHSFILSLARVPYWASISHISQVCHSPGYPGWELAESREQTLEPGLFHTQT